MYVFIVLHYDITKEEKKIHNNNLTETFFHKIITMIFFSKQE